MKRLKPFWEYVTFGDGCWLWQHKRHRQGYGLYGSAGYAHRISFEEAFGSTTLDVLHKCDNPPCVRPDHLFAGTHADNMRDRNQKGRWTPFRGEKHPMSKLTEIQVIEARKRFAQGETKRQIADSLGVTRELVGMIVSRKIWKSVT